MEDEEPLPFACAEDLLAIAGHTLRLVRPDEPYCAIECFLDEEDRGPDGFSCDVWPSSRALAALLLTAEEAPEGELFELGCGLGLGALAAAAAGWKVLASDGAGLCLELLAESARRNGFTSLETSRYCWGEPAPRRFARIVGADILYYEDSHAALWDSFDEALAPGGRIDLVDPERPATGRFFAVQPDGWRHTRRALGEGLALYQVERIGDTSGGPA